VAIWAGLTTTLVWEPHYNDIIAPIVDEVSVDDLTVSGGTLGFNSSEGGTYYYVVLPATDETPTVEAVKAGISGTATSGANSDIAISGLSADTGYKVYVVVVDAADNTSTVVGSDLFTTAPDTTAPSVSAVSVDTLDFTTGTLHFTSDEAGTYYYVVLGADETAPDADAIKAADSGIYGSDTAAASENTVELTELTAGTAYKAYVIVEDANITDPVVPITTIVITPSNDNKTFTIDGETGYTDIVWYVNGRVWNVADDVTEITLAPYYTATFVVRVEATLEGNIETGSSDPVEIAGSVQE
jgi:hypothetical protein